MTQNPVLKQKMCDLTGVAEVTGDIGVEIEVEGRNLPTAVTGWEIHDETSLRGAQGRTVVRGENLPDTPREYVTQRPVLYRNLLPKLRTLNEALTGNGVVVNLTTRASTHMHLNLGQETFGTFLRFVMIFATAEALLLRLCGANRNGNLFCLPTYETGELHWTLRSLCRMARSKTPSFKFHWPNRGKYSCLNTDPMGTQGSVEVRCFPNSIDYNEIDRWAGWLVNMRDLAQDLDISTALDTWYSRPQDFIRMVFGYAAVDEVCRPQTPAELVQFGVENTYELYRSVMPLFTSAVVEEPAGDAVIENGDVRVDLTGAMREIYEGYGERNIRRAGATLGRINRTPPQPAAPAQTDWTID